MAQLNKSASNNNGIQEKPPFIPKLRKNKKLDDKFGEKYFTALKQAIFSPFEKPYVPPDLPEFLRDQNYSPPVTYKCETCNDCFRFVSTYDEHVKRRSWILGYWCNACYSPLCTHKSSQIPCKACLNLEEKKRWYLRARGLTKGQKRGMINIFYNQCSFFEHLKSHNTQFVEPSDLMLMPFPLAVNKEEYSKLDEICGPLFERMFLLKIHVVDWLKSRDISNTWWKLADTENSPIHFLMKGHKSLKYFDDIMATLLKEQQNGNQTTSETVTRMSPMFIDLDNPEQEEENDEQERSDDPCPPVDIAFVDCGPTPKVAEIYPRRPKANVTEQTKTATPVVSQVPKISVKKFANDYSWTSETSETINKGVPSSVQKIQPPVTIAPRLIPVASSNNSILQSSKLKSDTKILTLRGPKGFNLSTLIKQLPHDVINNKKIVFVGQQTEKPAGLNIPPGPNVTTYKSIMPVLNDNKKPKFIKILPNSIKSMIVQSDDQIRHPNSQVVQSVDPKPNGTDDRDNVLVFKNNKKYIIKEKPHKVVLGKSVIPNPIVKIDGVLSLANASNNGTSTTVSTQMPVQTTENGRTESTPEKLIIKYLETDTTGEHLRVHADDNKHPILKSITRKRNLNSQATTFRYRQQMLLRLPLLPPYEISVRVEHFRLLIKRCKQVLNSKLENMLVGHNNMINLLLKAYEKSLENFFIGEKITDPEYDSYLDKWELGLHYVEQTRCKTCGKVRKPENYLFGLSRETKNPARYCSCGEFICYMCNLYQGNATRFQAHVEYHKKNGNFTCPECYQKHASYKQLAVHMWTSCFHTLTRRLLGCNICQIDGFESQEALARHFAIMHSHKKVSCSKCMKIYRTHFDCRDHQLKAHEWDKDISILKMIVCDVGDCVISPKLFRSHMSTHLGTQKLLYYKCPVCYSFIKDTGRGKDMIKLHLYVYHINKLSDIIEKDVLSEILASGLPEKVQRENEADFQQDRIESQNSKSRMTYPKIIDSRTISHEVFESVNKQSETSVSDSTKTYRKSSKSVNSSDSNLSLQDTDGTESSNWKRAKRKPGRIALNGPSSVANSTTQDYKCHLCGDLINTSWSVVRDHFGTKHADTYQLSILTPKLLRISNEFIERGYQEYIARKRKSDSGGTSPTKRRKRWTQKKQPEGASDRLSGMCVMPESSCNDKGQFVCKKCDKRCESANYLRQHIASCHRIKGMYLICLECGENFIVAPSLQMHLKAFHGIDDPINYLEQNPLHAAEVVDDLEEKMKAVVANQCHVCMAVFEDKAALDKHFRVHGMAFLNRKRIEAKKAIKTPEKDKVEGEEETIFVDVNEGKEKSN